MSADEFDEDERYACAALFVLALHQSQIESQVVSSGEAAAWGDPHLTDDNEAEPDPGATGEGRATIAAAQWSAFWGWDCCGPRGILEQLFAALRIPERSWAGLKRLPEIKDSSTAAGFMRLVTSHIQMLDPLLPIAHLARRARAPIDDPREHTDCGAEPLADGIASRPDLETAADVGIASRPSEGADLSPLAESREMSRFLDGVASDCDSDLEADLASVHLQARLQRQLSDCTKHPHREQPSSSGAARVPDTGAETASEPVQRASSAQIADFEAQTPLSGSDARQGDATPSDSVTGAGVRDAPGTPSGSLRGSEAGGARCGDPGDEHPAPEGAGEGSAGRKRSYSKAEALADAIQQWRAIGGSTEPDLRRSEGEESAVAADVALSHRQVPAKALAVLWVLLEACIAQPSTRAAAAAQESELCGDRSDKEDEAGGEPTDRAREQDGAKVAAQERATVGGVEPRVRWYDARARASLRLIASWLRVPWRMVVNFECLLAYRLLLPAEDGSSRELSPWERSLRAAKIGAATLTIGALFALTGGVAAPAIAGGVGAAIGLAGGSAAVAAGVSSFLGTTAGGAVIASTVGAAGVGLSAPHVAHRIGLVREFGFWPLGEELLRQRQQALLRDPPEPPESSGGEKAATESAASTPSNANEEAARGSREAVAKESIPTASDQAFVLRAEDISAGGEQVRASLGGETGRVDLESGQDAESLGATEDVPGVSQRSDREAGRRELLTDAGHITLAPAATKGGLLQPGRPDRTPELERTPNLGSPSPASKQEQSAERRAEPSKPKPSSPETGRRWWQKTAETAAEAPLLPSPIAPHGRVEDMRMSVTIGVSGWISQRRDFQDQWLDLAQRQKSSEAFTLVWESQELRDLNRAIVDFAASQAGQEAAKWVLQHFFIPGLIAALAWPALIYNAVQLIDTAWAVALQRAQKAGRLLAHTLAAGAHGDRPVILVGNSMGARLIFHCLLELARLKAKGVVEHACMLGTPVALRAERWAMARSVVSGRLINGFSRKDWLLAVVYRGANGFIKDAAGLCPAPFAGVENVNLTGLVQGHFDYKEKTEEILDSIDLYG